MPIPRPMSADNSIRGLYRKHIRSVIKHARRWYQRQVDALSVRRANAAGLTESAAMIALKPYARTWMASVSFK